MDLITLSSIEGIRQEVESQIDGCYPEGNYA